MIIFFIFTILKCILCDIVPPLHGSRPNIVLVLADDLGWQDVGFNGCTYYETPHIDQLAREGIISRFFYAGGPTCSPSRATMQSGSFATVSNFN
jgi:arylsulfatase A-like enzyme